MGHPTEEEEEEGRMAIVHTPIEVEAQLKGIPYMPPVSFRTRPDVTLATVYRGFIQAQPPMHLWGKEGLVLVHRGTVVYVPDDPLTDVSLRVHNLGQGDVNLYCITMDMARHYLHYGKEEALRKRKLSEMR